tara:strand:+ start:147 stop:296 length:150 start_codon:yes stop_codon:yes gene_type:complete
MNKPKSVKIETPIGSIESDSGNHLIDIATIVVVISFYLIIKKVFYKTFR